MVKGRFNGYFYLPFFFTLGFFIVSIYLFASPQLTLKGRTGHTFPAPLIGLIFFLLTSFLFYVLAKVIYLVTIDASSITIKGVFKRIQIERSEILSIDLFSREDFHWSAGTVTIGTRINLENGQKIVIADPFYSNIARLKQTITENFKEKIIEHSEKLNKKSNPLSETDFEKFAGNPHTSFNGLMLYGFIIFVAVLLMIKQNFQSAHLFLILPFTIFYLGFGYQLNYFLVSNHRLVVKNHILFWVNKHYDINDIAAINLETHSKRSTGLRITKNNFKSKLYSAGSLRRKNWVALKEKLKDLHLHFVE